MTGKSRNSRREVLKGIGAGAVAAAVSACDSIAIGPSRYLRPYSRNPWAVPRISAENVIRVVVGHRPFRQASRF